LSRGPAQRLALLSTSAERVRRTHEGESLRRFAFPSVLVETLLRGYANNCDDVLLVAALRRSGLFVFDNWAAEQDAGIQGEFFLSPIVSPWREVRSSNASINSVFDSPFDELWKASYQLSANEQESRLPVFSKRELSIRFVSPPDRQHGCGIECRDRDLTAYSASKGREPVG